MTTKDQWYRCSRCGTDTQMVNGSIKVCCWADKYPIDIPVDPRTDPEVSGGYRS